MRFIRKTPGDSQSRRIRGLVSVALIGAVGATVAAGVAIATPGSGTVGTPLGRGTIAEDVAIHSDGVKLKTDGPTDAVFVTQTWQPGGVSGWHSHPGPVILAVTAGALTVYDPECGARIVSAGDAFVEPVNEPMQVKNLGAIPAVAFFVILPPQGIAGRIDEADPGCGVS